MKYRIILLLVLVTMLALPFGGLLPRKITPKYGEAPMLAATCRSRRAAAGRRTSAGKPARDRTALVRNRHLRRRTARPVRRRQPVLGRPDGVLVRLARPGELERRPIPTGCPTLPRAST